MARETVVRMTDDLDGSAADGTVRFGLDGHQYEIDLSTRNEQEMRAKLGPYLQVARRMRPIPGRGRIVGDPRRNQAIRQWALDEGVELPTRGRISAAVQDAFDARDVNALYAATGLEQ